MSSLKIIILVLAALFALPVLTVAGHIFMTTDGTFAHLMSTVLSSYISNSFMLMIFVGLGTAVIGTGAAWLVVMCAFPGRRYFEWLLILPLAVPTYVIAYAYTDFFQFSGPLQSAIRELMAWGPQDFRLPNIRSLGGAILIFNMVLYPYVYLIARMAFLEQSASTIEVGRTLGAGPWRIFSKIGVPAARPAIAAGVALVLMETLADFGAVSYFGVPTFTTGIYRAWFSLGDKVAAAQLSTMLLGFVLLLIILEGWSRRQSRYDTGRSGWRTPPRYKLATGSGLLAGLFCSLPLILGFVLPVIILMGLAFDGLGVVDWARYGRWTWNTVSLGAITAVLALALALVVAYGRRIGGKLTRTLGRVASMGYAIPGSIIAVGVLIPFAALDTRIDSFFRDNFGFSTGLLLTGTVAALIFAYLVRFLSVSLHSVEAGLSKIMPSLDAAAGSLGAGPWRTMLEIHAPLLKTSLLTAFLMVLVDVMKELPATMIMRPFNFDTLAVMAHNFAADERLAEAAMPALTIVAVGILPVLVLSRMIANSGGRNLKGEDAAELLPGTQQVNPVR